ncbi:hypothetical protein DNTS_023868 [Danionella cerebrum]|uniref:Ubiquitin carboxyl-terminal hydrolase n=1 Tax=Danionella cerebrum TaxID=2873325 RepID=A0A553PX20_9TELE|nr:hypothetical protein DNTS_023868 [Danionella translucida]TRY82228.1 hypothetical protein DNTS_023868 [Danionella translucida]
MQCDREMEEDANPHRDAGGSVLCTAIPTEHPDIKIVGGMKDVCEKRDTLTTCSNASVSGANATPCTQTPRTAVETVGRSALSPDAAEQLSNGTGCQPLVAATAIEKDGAISKFVNKLTGEQPEISNPQLHEKAPRTVTAGEMEVCEPPHLCSDKASPGNAMASEQPAAEGPPSRSESRSFDSLETFSQLNSCPSSELNSEAPEERALALAGAEGAKITGAKDRATGQSLYHIKWIKWKEENTPIITQNENGPCPLLAIMNVLLLSWKVKLPPMMEIITAEQLMEYLGDYILEAKPKEISEAQRLNYEQVDAKRSVLLLMGSGQSWDTHGLGVGEARGDARLSRVDWLCCLDALIHPLAIGSACVSLIHPVPCSRANMSDAMAVLHKLQTGLDVNVKFTGVRVFEYTPECIVFDLLDIPLYHGWLVDPQMADIVKAVGNCSYNQLVEKIISCKQSDSSELAGEGFVAEQFLNSTATQLTYHGLCELTSTVEEGELCVFFRNNHFSTMTKFKGFLTEEKVVWESLHNVDGDGNFCDSEFRLRPPSDPETVYRGQQDQIDQDYLMALSLQQEQQACELGWEQIPEGISDLELAKKLQEEEDRRASQYYQEQEQAQAAAAAAAQGQGDQPVAGADQVDRAAATAASTAGAAASPSAGKQPSPGERKPKKEAKDKDKCVLL